MNLSKVKTYDLIAELRNREDVGVVINDRSSSNYAISVDRGDLYVDKGECIILICQGLYDVG